MKEKPRRVFTLEEYTTDPAPAHRSAGLYPGIKVVDAEGEQVLSVSLGTPDRTCAVCEELPDFCESSVRCSASWRTRAVAAENKVREVRDSVMDAIGWP